MGMPQIPEHPGEGRDESGGTSVDPADAATELRHHQALMDGAENDLADRHNGYGSDSGALPDSMPPMTWAQDDVGQADYSGNADG